MARTCDTPHSARWLTTLLGLVLVVAVAAGCGTSDDVATTGDPTPVPTTAPVDAPTPTVIPTATVEATTEPTAVPTVAPTTEPTAAPTVAATATAAPTVESTATPVPTSTTAPTAVASSTPVPTATSPVVPTPTPTVAPKPIEGTFELAAGEDIVVSFVVPAGTNYRWQMIATPNPAVVTLVDEIYISPGIARAGQAGSQHFTFRGVSDGTETVHFWLVDLDDTSITPLQLASYEMVVGTGVPGCAGVFHVEVGEEFEIVLGVNPATGFSWELAQSPAPGIVSLVRLDNPSADTQRFVFRGVADGETALKFWSVRPTDVPPVPNDFVQFEAIVGTGILGCSGVFEIDVAEEFQVVIEANPTTGYRWQFEEPLDNDVLVLVSDEYIAPTTDAVGASGWQRFTFRGVGEGQADIHLWYVRPFDDPLAPVDTSFFKAVVGDGVS